MKKSNNNLFKIFSIFLICLIYILQCDKAVNDPQAANEPAPILFKLTLVNPPSSVHSIVGLLERSGYDPIQQAFTVTGDTAIGDFGQVVAGIWHLSVTAFDSNQTAIYFGETDVTVLAGQFNIVNLHMNPLTGELIVVVSWSDGSTDNYALEFDGIDDRVIVTDNNGNLDSLSNQITIEAWIFAHSIPAYNKPRIVDRSDDAYTDRFILHFVDGTQIIAFNINANKVYSNNIPLSTWVHVAGTYDGQIMKVYVNGNLEASSYVSTIIDVKNSDLYIGSAGPVSSSSGIFNGLIDDVRIWNIARTQQEIQNNLSVKLTGNETGLAALWSFDEGEGQVVGDGADENNGILGSSSATEPDDPVWQLIN